MGLACSARLCSCPVTAHPPAPFRVPWSAAEKQVAELLPLDPLSTASGPPGFFLSRRGCGKCEAPGTCRPVAGRTRHTSSRLGTSPSGLSVPGDRAAWAPRGTERTALDSTVRAALAWGHVCLATTVFARILTVTRSGLGGDTSLNTWTGAGIRSAAENQPLLRRELPKSSQCVLTSRESLSASEGGRRGRGSSNADFPGAGPNDLSPWLGGVSCRPRVPFARSRGAADERPLSSGCPRVISSTSLQAARLLWPCAKCVREILKPPCGGRGLKGRIKAPPQILHEGAGREGRGRMLLAHTGFWS